MDEILLCPNPGRDKNLGLTMEVYRLLVRNGHYPVVSPLFARYGGYCELPEDVRVRPLEEELPKAKMVLVFGGDGTILYTARQAAKAGVPVLGINMGNKGFIAELERTDIDLVLKAVSGKYALESRMMLDVEVLRGGATVFSDFALNDAVVGGIARVIDLRVCGDGKKITAFAGDGIVVATPTGSTAYSMAAGGPIVEPAAENIIITPICAHALIERSFVLAPDRKVSVEVGYLGKKSAYLSVDGEDSMNLLGGDVLQIRKSEHVTRLVRVSERSFYEKVSEKLGERRT